MPRKSLKNRKLSPWVTEGVEHWRWLEDRLHPLFEVTSPKYSGAWMDEVETQGHSLLRRRLAEHRFIERMRRIERNRIIDKMLAEANQYAQRQHERRQRIMEVKLVTLDEEDGRAEVVLGSPPAKCERRLAMGDLIQFPGRQDFVRRFEARLLEVIAKHSLPPTRQQYHPGLKPIVTARMIEKYGPMTRAEIDEKIQRWLDGNDEPERAA